MDFRKSIGLTLVELLIAIAVAVVLLTGFMRAYIYFAKSALRHRATAELQQGLTTASEMLERDIRMCGFGLPGNGLEVRKSNAATDTVVFFSNRRMLHTSLVHDASAFTDTVRVGSISGVEAGMWLCLDRLGGGSPTYCQIRSIGGNLLHLVTNVGAEEFSAAQTKVYFADRVMYFVNNSVVSAQLVRMVNATPYVLCSLIAKVVVAAKDSLGTALSGDYHKARSLSITISGGGDGPRDALSRSETVEAAIRNYK